MSQKETITNPVTLNDYEKSKSKFENEEYSQEEFLTLARLYSESFNDVKEGEIVKGRVVRIQGDNVILDVGFKSEGSVPLSDFLNREEEISDQRNAILESLEKGQILEGTVKAIAVFGVFVGLGGVDGLIHITDLSWGRINHPNEIVKLDETIKVVVTDFDEEKKRISLGF